LRLANQAAWRVRPGGGPCTSTPAVLLFEAIGGDGMELADLSETPLDDRHTLVRTSWNLRMRNGTGRDPISLRSTFILRRDDGAWRIVLYLNHQDMAKFFTGLAPAPA